MCADMWKKIIVAQKRPKSGCIPWSLEMLLRAKGVKGIDMDSFQDTFDRENNSYTSVITSVHMKYADRFGGNLIFGQHSFVSADGKIDFIRDSHGRGRYLVASIHLNPGCTKCNPVFHSMPVIDVSGSSIYFLNGMMADGGLDVMPLTSDEIRLRHDSTNGGRDVAYLL